MSTAEDIGDDLENWMSRLPAILKNMPIVHLAIPGSHDSGSYSITPSSPMAPDAIPFVRQLAKVFGSLVKRMVFNWSVTQNASIKDQLLSGIRYFDLRLGTKTGAKAVFIVHGQYGVEIKEVLQDVSTFLADHEGEIVVLDFQHFYSFTGESHSYFMNILSSYFGNKICPFSHNITHISLQWMFRKGYQVIIIYRNDAARSISTFWPSSKWPTPWPETTSINSMIVFLEKELANRPLNAGFVTQCVLTPDVKFFLKHFYSNLERKCAEPCNRAMIPWLEKQQAGSKGINVVICDFINMKNIPFCKTVIKLNANLLEAGNNK